MLELILYRVWEVDSISCTDGILSSVDVWTGEVLWV